MDWEHFQRTRFPDGRNLTPQERWSEAIWVVFFGGLPYGAEWQKEPTEMEGFNSRLQAGLEKEL